MSTTRLASWFCGAIWMLAGVSHAADQPARPNIVIILADDMGFSDLGCYGGEIPTPNLDKLAAGGLRFTQFYNTARCCPTRASLLTGLYPHQTGVGHMTDDRGAAGYRGRLNDRCVTIADVLREAGYFTAMSGKWHVGQNFGVVPWERGFDRSLDAPVGGFYYGDSPRARLFLNGRQLDPKGAELPENWYSTDLWTDFGIKFIDEALAAHKPFFLYLAHNAPHFPLQAPAEEIARFRGKYRRGWDALRQERHARQIDLGIVERSWPLSPRPPEVKPWGQLTVDQQARFDHIMAIYAAVVSRMDASVGRLVEALGRRTGDSTPRPLAPTLAPDGDKPRVLQSTLVMKSNRTVGDAVAEALSASACPVNENGPLTTAVNGPVQERETGFEPATSSLGS